MQSQQHMSTSTQAPFFLPPQQQTRNSYFPLSSSPSAVKQHKRSHSLQQQRGQAPFFKTNDLSKKQKEVEVESQSSERLTALHSRLQLEAEKIRKWKNATELELKHKQKCLEEANCTIESQRRSLTDLQLKNESLQSMLNDEIANQKEIRRKIASTREMCTVLKNHSVKIDDSISKGEEDRDRLMILNQERMLNFQELLEKFKQLESGQTVQCKKFEDALAIERGKCLEAENECKSLFQQLEVAKTSLSSLKEQRVEDKQTIENLKVEIDTKAQQRDLLSKEKEKLDHTLSMKKEDLKHLEHQVHDLRQELTAAQERIANKAHKLDEAQSTMKKNQMIYNENVSQLELSLASVTEECKTLAATKEDLESSHQQEVAKFNEKYQAMTEELEETVQELNRSCDVAQCLEVELNSARKICEELGGEKQCLESHVKELEGKLLGMSEEVNQHITEKEKGLTKAESLLSDVVSRHESARRCWIDKEKELTSQVGELQKEKEGLSSEIGVFSLQLGEMKNNLEEQMKTNSDQLIKYEENIHSLSAEKTNLIEENVDLKKRIQILTENKENLTSQCLDRDKVVAENLQLKLSLDVKITENEKIQKELLQVQAEASATSKELMALIEKLKAEVITSRMTEIQNKESHELEVTKLKEEMRAKTSELTALVEQSKKETEAVKKDLEQGKKDYEREVQDLVAALDSYRSEHEKNISVKDKTIENLRQQFDESEKSKKLRDSELKACEDKIAEFQSEIDTKNEEMKELLRSIESMCYKKPSSTSASNKTPQIVSTSRPPKSTPLTALSDITNEVSCTPTAHKAPSVSSKSCQQAPNLLPLPSTPLRSVRSPKVSVPSSRSRMYDYCVTTTPQYKNKLTHSTPRYSGRAKRMHYQCDVENENEEEIKHRSNISYAQDDDEAVFKRPKPKDANVTVRKASSTTSTSKSTAKAKRQSVINRNKRGKGTTEGKKGSGGKASEDLSWFDLDSVYGFEIND